ncbi:TPA: helix-turn-helix domain-containing protein [Pseudomonas aeruginosa]
MQKRPIRQGRPRGKTTYEAGPAKAFGMAVRAFRSEQQLAQELLANLSGVDRSHIGKIERGEHMPTLSIILRIAEALNCSASTLVAQTEENLALLRDSSVETL